MGTRPLRAPRSSPRRPRRSRRASPPAVRAAAAAPSSRGITISSNQCGGTWPLARPGWHTFEINNQGTGGAEVDLVDPANGAIYAEIENTGPATINPMSLDVGSGKYALLCLFTDFNPLQGATVTVPGHAAGTPAIMPVTYNDLIPLAKKYQTEEETAIKVLARRRRRSPPPSAAGT